MIKRLRIRNYLSLKEVDLELGPRNLLVGPNKSGKSNLIDCLRFLTTMPVGGLKTAFMDRNGFGEVLWKGPGDPHISLGLIYEMPEHLSPAKKLYEYEISIRGSHQTGLIAVESERLDVVIGDEKTTLIDLKNGQGKLLHVNGQDAVLTPIDPSNSALESNVPNWEASTFKAMITMSRFYRLIPQHMKQPNAAVRQQFLNQTGDNFSSWFMTLQGAYPNEFKRIKQVAVDVFPGLEELLTPPTQFGTTFVSTRERGLRGPITIWRMSDGEIMFLALLSLIFAPGDLGAPLYCIEEPENYLHPKLIEVLAETLIQRQKELGSRIAQIIATTHSTWLINQFSLDELLAVVNREGATSFQRPGSREYLKKILESGDLNIGDLFYSGALEEPNENDRTDRGRPL